MTKNVNIHVDFSLTVTLKQQPLICAPCYGWKMSIHPAACYFQIKRFFLHYFALVVTTNSCPLHGLGEINSATNHWVKTCFIGFAFQYLRTIWKDRLTKKIVSCYWLFLFICCSITSYFIFLTRIEKFAIALIQFCNLKNLRRLPNANLPS